MENLKLFDAEYKFMSIVWEHEPVNSTELTRICQTELNWKKSTTYSMIKKLSERRILKSENATVTTLIKRGQIQRYEVDALLNKSFGGSFSSLVATLLKDKSLSEAEAQEIKKAIEEAANK